MIFFKTFKMTSGDKNKNDNKNLNDIYYKHQ